MPGRRASELGFQPFKASLKVADALLKGAFTLSAGPVGSLRAKGGLAEAQNG